MKPFISRYQAEYWCSHHAVGSCSILTSGQLFVWEPVTRYELRHTGADFLHVLRPPAVAT